MIARHAGAAALLLLLAGCSVVERVHARPTGAEWSRLRAQYSRQITLYDGFIHRATATVTYLSPEVREARARQLGEWLSWSPEELERSLTDERATAASYDEFVVSFFVADFISNDLDAPQSVWRMAVELPGAAILPVAVRSVDRDPTITSLYPWVGRFDVIYVLRFPRAPEPPLAQQKFVLMISSAMGQLPLDFGAPPGRIRLPDQAP